MERFDAGGGNFLLLFVILLFVGCNVSDTY